MQSFTRAERQAAIAASRDPFVRRAARELDSKVDDAGIDPDAVVEARQLLVAAVADALRSLGGRTPRKRWATSPGRPRCSPSARPSS